MAISTHKFCQYHPAACSAASDELKCSGTKRKASAWLSLVLLLLAALLAAGSTASAADPHGEAAAKALDRGNHVFLFEDFPSVDNAWGSLQVNSVARVKGHEERQVTMLRATFSSTAGKQLELVASAAEEGLVSLTVSTENSEWTMRWNEDSQPVLYGLLEPRNPSHIKSIISHGINVEDLPRYFKPAIHPDDFDVIVDFLAFQNELPYSHPEFLVDQDWELLAEKEWQRLCQLSLDHLSDEERALIEDAVRSSAWSCLSSALVAAGSTLQLWQSSVECAMCLISRIPVYCNPCAAKLGIASGSLMGAIVHCFGDDGPAPDDPPPPPPPGAENTLPAPIPAPGGWLVPIYQVITTVVCVDGDCWTQTHLIVSGWRFVELP